MALIKLTWIVIFSLFIPADFLCVRNIKNYTKRQKSTTFKLQFSVNNKNTL